MDERLSVLNQIHSITPQTHNHTGRLAALNKYKTIRDSPEFIEWSQQAKYILGTLIPNPLIDDIIKTIDGLSGWNDESDYEKIKSAVKIIDDHPDDFLPKVEDKTNTPNDGLSHGTIIHTAFNDYELLKQVGQGGNGKVFSAKATDGIEYAIKFVERDESNNKFKRLKNEMHFCENSEHKNIVKILDRGYVVLDGTPYIFYVMPLYPDTLRARMKNGLSPDEAIAIFVGILQGLKYAHERGTYHRDIKPENILFAEGSNEPVICDFGIAHFAEDDLITAVETKATDRLANFQYAAPEQRIKGGAKEVDGRADVYAAGLILNEMFTNEIPQSVGHKTIKSINPEYALLDDLFDMLYHQNPDERLFPADKILIKLGVLLENIKAEKAKQALENANEEEIESIDFSTNIINRYFRNDMLVFELDNVPPDLWKKVLVNGYYAHSARSGYNPKFLIVDMDTIMMPLKGLRDKTIIQEIAKHVTEWVPATNAYYVDLLKKRAAEKRRKEEIERKNEAEKMQEAVEVNSYLAEL